MKRVAPGNVRVAPGNVHRMCIPDARYTKRLLILFLFSLFSFSPWNQLHQLASQLASIGINWHQQGPMGRPTVNQAVIVTPSSLVMNWAAEFKKWLGNERCRPIAVNKSGKAAKEQVEDFVAGRGAMAPVLIISYEM